MKITIIGSKFFQWQVTYQGYLIGSGEAMKFVLYLGKGVESGDQFLKFWLTLVLEVFSKNYQEPSGQGAKVVVTTQAMQ